MSQNSVRVAWTEEDLAERLENIMRGIHQTCVTYGDEGDYVNYLKGSNIGGFIKIADAMVAYGVM